MDSYNLAVVLGIILAGTARAATHASQPAGEKARPSGNTQDIAEKLRFDPVPQELEGWTVHVDPGLLHNEHRELGTQTLKMPANHLQRIAMLLPDQRLAEMRTLETWIERRHCTLTNLQYHPSINWLKSHGHDLRLAKNVNTPRARKLPTPHEMLKHPLVVLHELAHAYNDQYLGFDNPRIVQAYEQATTAKTYERVLRYDGKTVFHYALINNKEYFAEGTEAYFYRNDFYPFCRAKLEQHDPTLHDFLVDIWGPLQ